MANAPTLDDLEEVEPEPVRRTPVKKKKAPRRKPRAVKEGGIGSYARALPGSIKDLNRITWGVRAAIFSLCVSAAINMALVALVFALLPLKQTVPYLVMLQNSKDLIVNTQPMQLTKTTQQFLLENIVREYVVQRNKIYPIGAEMTLRWLTPDGFIASYSSNEIYQRFQTNAREQWTKFQRNPVYQNVEINRVRQFSNLIWEVEFSTTEILPGTEEEINQKFWKSGLTLSASGRGVRGQEPTKIDHIKNPFGVEVIHYTQEQVVQ